jgi:hypothetical protein
VSALLAADADRIETDLPRMAISIARELAGRP